RRNCPSTQIAARTKGKDNEWAWACHFQQKGAPNQGRSRSPCNRADRTAPGRRSLAGARSKYRLCWIQEPVGLRVAVFLEAVTGRSRVFQIVSVASTTTHALV